MGTRLPSSYGPRGLEPQREGDATTAPSPAARTYGDRIDKTEALIDRTSPRETDSEDRNKQRRLDEEAYRQQLDQRTHESRTRKVLFEKRQSSHAGQEKERVADRAPKEPANSRQAVQRATAGLDRAGSLLLRGQGPEAHQVLSKEKLEARAAARELGRGDPTCGVLSGLACHMDVRGRSLRTTIPADARKLAHRMEQIARATDTRAEKLASRGHGPDANVLRSVATDSRLQAALLRAAAANVDALLGRALARGLAGLVKEGVSKSDLALDRALRDTDHAIETDRCPLHRFLGRDPKRSRAVAILRKSDRTGALLDPFRDLSAALSRGDTKATAAARKQVLESLHRTRQLPQLERLLDTMPGVRPTTSASELLDRSLPRLLLDGVRRGTITEMAKSGGLEPWLRSLHGMPQTSRALLPGEKALVAHAQGTQLTAKELGPIESLLLGGPSLYAAQGTVSHHLATKGLLDPALASLAGDPAAFVMLPPAATHEHAVVLSLDGAVMVRTDEGPQFFHGHLTGGDEQRYYYNSLSLDEGLRKVRFQSAADPGHHYERIELGVDRLLDEEDEGERVASQSKRRHKPIDQGESAENLVAVAQFNGEPEPAEGYQGLATRFSARLAEDELDQLNQTLPEEERTGHLYLEYASDCSLRLNGLGYANADAFQAHLDAKIEELGFTNRAIGALILIGPTVRFVAAPSPKDPELLQESLVLYSASIVTD